MRYFFDEGMSRPLSRAMAILSERLDGPLIEIRHQWDIFQQQGTEDIDWIKYLTDQGDWVVVSCDTRITKLLNERIAWVESGLTAFFMQEAFPKLVGWEQVIWLVKAWPTIVQTSIRTPSGTGYIVNANGKVEPLDMRALRARLPRDKQRLAKSRS